MLGCGRTGGEVEPELFNGELEPLLLLLLVALPSSINSAMRPPGVSLSIASASSWRAGVETFKGWLESCTGSGDGLLVPEDGVRLTLCVGAGVPEAALLLKLPLRLTSLLKLEGLYLS